MTPNTLRIHDHIESNAADDGPMDGAASQATDSSHREGVRRLSVSLGGTVDYLAPDT